MSISEQELIDRLRHGYEAFNRGDFDAAVGIAHPDLVVVPPGGQSERVGAKAFRAWMEPDAFESQTIEPEVIEVVGNHVLVLQHATARGAGSGIEIEIDTWAIWTFDDEGMVVRIETYLPHQEDEARRALDAS
jgi:ketosteroid isomerase-like protein